jgi:NAD(P)-dependent dehydrogenase (short-subunit alcohol dehydrogenase family)
LIHGTASLADNCSDYTNTTPINGRFIKPNLTNKLALDLERHLNQEPAMNPSSPTPIALITGGSRGLGKSMALQLARRGTDVLLTYRSNRKEAEGVVAEIEKLGRRAVALQLDVGVAASFGPFVEQVRAALKNHWQRDTFDFLVNNAGIGVHAPFAETTEAQFDELVNIHLKGPFFLTQKLLPVLADGGRIVNISTGLARFALPGYSAYAAMKGAIEVLTRYQAKELGSRGIAVNVVAPGAIETDFGGGAVRDNKQLNDMVASNTALGRVGLPDDIGGVVASLLSPENRWINAQRIEASGGQML